MTAADHRRFSRIPFVAHAELRSDREQWPAELIDISLKGALVTLAPGKTVALGQRLTLAVQIDGGGASIYMDAQVAHQEPGRIGLRCLHIDLDSITHLRRLVELNLGDPARLDRELHALGGGEPGPG